MYLLTWLHGLISFTRLLFETKKKTIVQTLIEFKSFTNDQTDSKITVELKYDPSHFLIGMRKGKYIPVEFSE